MGALQDDTGNAEYVFTVRLRLSPSDSTVRVDPATVETTLFKRAASPGTEGWLFFRDNLWRGEVNDHDHMCNLAAEMLGVDIESVEFRELRTDKAYYESLQDAIADDLELFNADDVPEVLTKYVGSSINVVGET